MWCEHMVRSLYNSTNTALILIPLMLCVPAVIVIRNSDTFDNYFGMIFSARFNQSYHAAFGCCEH